MADTIKFVIALAIIAAAIGGFYIYADQLLLFRVLGLLAAVAISSVIMLQTAPGRQAWAFFGEARTEVRKVVWPTRKETTQTTLMIIAIVFVVAVLMGIFDWFLTWAVRILTGQGG